MFRASRLVLRAYYSCIYQYIMLKSRHASDKICDQKIKTRQKTRKRKQCFPKWTRSRRKVSQKTKNDKVGFFRCFSRRSCSQKKLNAQRPCRQNKIRLIQTYETYRKNTGKKCSQTETKISPQKICENQLKIGGKSL